MLRQAAGSSPLAWRGDRAVKIGPDNRDAELFWMTKPPGTVWRVSPECKYQDDTSNARIDSDKGKQIYSHRMSTVEPVFANLEHNKGLKRFSLRGKKKVQAQWQLFAVVHNIEKLIPKIG
jgi:hypothetical protein